MIYCYHLPTFPSQFYKALPLKIHLQSQDSVNLVKQVQNTPDGYVIDIGDEQFTKALILTSECVEMWDVESVSALSSTHFSALSTLPVEVVILGTGRKIEFPDPKITQALMHKGIGLEVMDTPAACRTYNILAGDGRKVAAAIIL